jgi:signal transduction histidine kinase
MDGREHRRWPLDVAVAAVVAAVGLVEVWLPMESVMGQGSTLVSTLGILWFAGHLTQRRIRPRVAMGALLIWPVLGLVTGGQLQILFFGQLVPLLVLVFSMARHGRGRQRWLGAAGVAVLLVVGDLFVPLLQSPNEIVFHWAAIVLAYLCGHGLQVSADRAAAHAVRAHQAETASHERAMAAIAEERARIARELHDIVAHSVGVIVVQAGAAEQVVEDEPEVARAALATIRTTGASALAEMRRVVAVLRSPDVAGDLAPQPGLATLPALVDAVQRAGLQVDLEVRGNRTKLPAGLDLTVYRIVQEALTNVRRHSHADRAAVVMEFGHDALEIHVRDTGPSRPGSGEPGHGILGMRERTALFGGHVRAFAEEHGFTVHAVLPLERT